MVFNVTPEFGSSTPTWQKRFSTAIALIPKRCLGLVTATVLLAGCMHLEPSQPAEGSERINPQTRNGDFLTETRNERCQPYVQPDDDVDAYYPPSPPDDLWQRIRDGFSLDHSIENARIDSELRWYAGHQAYMDRVSQRAEKYLYYIVNQLEEQDLPLELALLPIVESAFDPFAYSHGRAAGMWQFIPGTGRMYDLKIDWWYDGRRDVIASTEAAIAYLSRLNRAYDGDWLLALAAYNSGQGTVNKAIRKNRKRNKATDFWSLKLPRETQAYVPKLIALAKLINQPDHFGLQLDAIPNRPYFAVVDVGSQIDLAQAAGLADVPLNELYRLNPGFSRWATSPEGPHRLLLPVDTAEQFARALDNVPLAQRVEWKRHTIRSGESLITIAKRYNTTPSVIRDVNKLNSNLIRAGATLMVPTSKLPSERYVLSETQRLDRRQNSRPNSDMRKIRYVVKPGDSLWKIARDYKVSQKQLARWNHLGLKDPIKPRQTLVIWVKPHSRVASTMDRDPMIRKIGYRVRQGDSLARIAGKFNVSVNDIARWNTLNTKHYLQPGQSLTLFVDVTSTY